METFQQKTERNFRVKARYDELMREGRHGHYETMFRVAREEAERERAACAASDRRMNAKLYIWADPYTIRYGTTMLLAVAETEEAARKIAEGAPVYKFAQYKSKAAGGGVKLGEPARVVDLPCAEWHEWQE